MGFFQGVRPVSSRGLLYPTPPTPKPVSAALGFLSWQVHKSPGWETVTWIIPGGPDALSTSTAETAKDAPRPSMLPSLWHTLAYSQKHMNRLKWDKPSVHTHTLRAKSHAIDHTIHPLHHPLTFLYSLPSHFIPFYSHWLRQKTVENVQSENLWPG